MAAQAWTVTITRGHMWACGTGLPGVDVLLSPSMRLATGQWHLLRGDPQREVPPAELYDRSLVALAYEKASAHITALQADLRSI